MKKCILHVKMKQMLCKVGTRAIIYLQPLVKCRVIYKASLFLFYFILESAMIRDKGKPKTYFLVNVSVYYILILLPSPKLIL